MRYLLIILFFPFTVFSQEKSITFSFAPASEKLNTEQRDSLLKKIEGKTIEVVELKGYVGSDAELSKNRIRVEQRLFSLEQFFIDQDVPKNKILIERVNTDDEKLFNKVAIIFQFVAPKTGRVFFKTDVAEISDFEAIQRKRQLELEKNDSSKPTAEVQKIAADSMKPKPEVPKKTYGKLNIEDFKAGQKVVIPELYFMATRHKLRPISYRSLGYLLEILRDKPTLVVELQGHICCKKNGKDGMDFDTQRANLSVVRAQAIYYFLINNGISPSRLSYRGFGSKYKLVEDKGDAIKGLVNRRVEVFVISE